MADDCRFKVSFEGPPFVRVAEPGWVRLTSRYTELPVLIRRDGQVALTPSDQRDGGTIVYAAGKTHAVSESFETVRSYFGADLS